MSQFLYFFARHDKEFILIADYSRSTQVYSEVNAPYEKIRKIDETELRSVAERLRAGKNFAKSQIEALNRELELISSANNSLEEKLDVINSELEIIEEYEDDIQTLDRYAIELDFIANMACDNDIFVGFEISYPAEKILLTINICRGGRTGICSGLKIRRRKDWGFESPPRHHPCPQESKT